MCATRMSVSGALLLLLLGATGCSSNRYCITTCDVYDSRCWEADLIQTSYNAVDCLLRQTGRADPTRRVLVATTVNLDDVQNTSTFGRLVGEFLSSRLAQHGFAVVQMTLRHGSVVIKQDGQFLLSRDMGEVAKDYDAACVLVSTYTPARYKVYISVKLVNTAANEVIAAVDYSIPKSRRILALLRNTPSRREYARY